MAATIDDLKTAGDLVERAAELVHEAAKETSLPSVALRQSVGEQIARIRLKLMLLRGDVTILHNIVNRRKPRHTRKEAEG